MDFGKRIAGIENRNYLLSILSTNLAISPKLPVHAYRFFAHGTQAFHVTKKETIYIALQELVRACQRQELISQKGSNLLDLTLEELSELRNRRTRKSSGCNSQKRDRR